MHSRHARTAFMALLLLSASAGLASPDGQELPDCHSHEQRSSQNADQSGHCLGKIEDMRPGQFALGYREVDERADDIASMSDKKLRKYVADHIVPVVVGPGDEYYTVDRHHYMAAMQQAAANDRKVIVKIIANWSELSDTDFFERMRNQHYFYLYDATGMGPQSPTQLPGSVAGMENDPYRSLAWAVRKAGGYCETDVYFADFQWANFFRSRVQFDDDDDDEFKQAKRLAVQLAHTQAARNLPGYLPDHAGDCDDN